MLALLLLSTLAGAAQSAQSAQAALADPDPAKRLRALGDIDRARTVAALEDVAFLAEDDEDAVQLAAIDTLLNLCLPERVSERRKVALVIEVRRSSGAQGAFEAGAVPSVAVPPGVFEPLAGALGDLNPAVRRNAAYAISVLAAANAAVIPAETIPLLASGLGAMLTSPDLAVRIAGARAAGRAFRAPTVVSIATIPGVDQTLSNGLIALMNQPGAEDQSAAMQALGLIRDVRGLQALADRFAFYRAEGPRELALVALEAIARIAHPLSEDLVRRIATDSWANRDEDTALTVAFARERLLHDGSKAYVQAAAGKSRTRARAEGYLIELR